ncbi:MAG: hypothetical protein WCJ70_01285 [bacterium]
MKLKAFAITCITLVFIVTTALFSLWSWVLVDPNFTLVEHADWAAFREWAVQIGYLNRPFSSEVFVWLVVAITLSSWLLAWRPPKYIFLLSVLIGGVAGLLSYPALSHDLFNYIFDARILTHYGQNPYLHKALDFPLDPTVRFMHWTHRTYPYGPTYLLLSLIPSILGMGAFSLTFLLFKLSHVLLYLASVKSLLSINKKAAAIFAFSPLVIVEGLINTHNDFVAVCLCIIGINLLHHKKAMLGTIALVTSGLIKYLTLPVTIVALAPRYESVRVLGRKYYLKPVYPILSLIGVSGLLLYLLTHGEIHPWYFLNLLVFLPYFTDIFLFSYPFILGLLLSYYPYVAGGEWGQGADVGVKNSIIYVGFFFNIALYFALRIYKYKSYEAVS